MKSILIIEDDDYFRDLLKLLFEDEDYNVMEASNSRDALNILQKENPDLIITDIIMEEGDGLEIIINSKKNSPEKPIIAISGGGSIGPKYYLSTARALGAEYTFAKPFSTNEMINMVKSIMTPSIKKILIIEDDDNVRDMLKRLLEGEAYKVIEARNGGEALIILKVETPDLIITDIIMEDVDGLEIIVGLKKDKPNIPIIAISGGGSLGSNAYLSSAKALGADYTFTKPFSFDEIQSTLKKLLND